MRKILLFALAATMLTSCDYFKSSSKEDETEEESPKKKKKKKQVEEDTEEEDVNADEEETTPKKKKSYSDDDDVSEEDTNTEDTNTGWTSKEKTSFINQCVGQAVKNVSQDRAKVYCTCMLDKIMDKYPSMTVADSKMTETEMNSLAYDCNK